jgi:hypothetical protein
LEIGPEPDEAVRRAIAAALTAETAERDGEAAGSEAVVVASRRPYAGWRPRSRRGAPRA